VPVISHLVKTITFIAVATVLSFDLVETVFLFELGVMFLLEFKIKQKQEMKQKHIK